MSYLRLMSFVVSLLLVGAGYTGASEGESSSGMRRVKLVEYRTQFSNMGTKAGMIFEIFADKTWQKTGVRLRKGDSVIISYLNGKWRVNPAHEEYDANGCPGSTVDNESYVLRFVNEGALIGKIGTDGEPFFIGNTRKIIADNDGELFLITNDDLNQEKGDGYADNQGYLNIVVYKISDAD